MRILQPPGWPTPRGYVNGVAADKREYLSRGQEVGVVFREEIGVYRAATSAVQVSALMEDRSKVEIEVTAVEPDGAPSMGA
jgi:enamine deaminase RidA (YjgF/YER057c/UK114 family)